MGNLYHQTLILLLLLGYTNDVLKLHESRNIQEKQTKKTQPTQKTLAHKSSRVSLKNYKVKEERDGFETLSPFSATLLPDKFTWKNPE